MTSPESLRSTFKPDRLAVSIKGSSVTSTTIEVDVDGALEDPSIDDDDDGSGMEGP